MRERQIRRGNGRNNRQQERAVRAREIRRFGERGRELCPQDFLGQEALRCFEKSNGNQRR